ncbi:MAG: sulfate permease [Sandarakinorhabdus sp.]|nr:sulfate permease [Sandarakinorhabdus sp.]MBS3961970.1 sulfate permease [Sandarakinorhabdus sp.]
MSKLARYLPILDWGRHYGGATLTSDLMAALIVTSILIPQALGYALLAGLPPVTGIYAAILPLVLYAIFGTSRALAVGPVAVVSLMTATALAQVAEQGTMGYAVAAATLAFLSGAMLVLMGVLRLGVLANFLSHPVTAGFISAAGLLIALRQFGHLLGIGGAGDTLPEIAASLLAGLPGVHWPTLAIGALATGFLYLVRARMQHALVALGLPSRLAGMLAKAGPLYAMTLATLAVWLGGLEAQGVKVLGEVPQGLPPFALPSLSPQLVGDLILAAALISLVGFVESISVAQALAAKRRQRIDPDQELIGLGAANLGASVSGAFPVTGGFARSFINFDAGAVTPAAGMMTALGMLVGAMVLTPLLYFLPKAALAATILVAVLGLVDLPAFRRTWRYSKADFAAMAVTAALVLAVGVKIGIMTGVGLSIFLFLWRTSRPHYAIVGRVPGSEHFRNIKRHTVETDPAVLTIRVDESLYFANARFLEDMVQSEVVAHPEVRNVVLMCPAVNVIDASALESLEAINRRLADAGIGFHLSEVKGPVMDALARSHLPDDLNGRIWPTQHEAFETLVRQSRATRQ